MATLTRLVPVESENVPFFNAWSFLQQSTIFHTHRTGAVAILATAPCLFVGFVNYGSDILFILHKMKLYSFLVTVVRRNIMAFLVIALHVAMQIIEEYN